MMGKNHMPDDQVAIIKMSEEYAGIVPEEKSVYISGRKPDKSEIRPKFTKQFNEKSASVLESIVGLQSDEENEVTLNVAPETQVISMRPGYSRKKDGKYVR